MSHKRTALEFLRMAAAGQAHEAFDRYAAADFIHHNAYFKGDAHSLMTAMDDSAKKNPGTVLDVKHAVEERDLVSVHSHARHRAGDRGYATCHIFRFVDGKIAELWDFAQEVPADSPNENGMF
jgi:predicted SnoaL-like aldol condensation-catalyzing enzyme